MQNQNKGSIHKTAAACQDREDIRGVHEESNRDVQRVVEGERLGSVQGSAPSGARKQGSGVVEGSTFSKTEEQTSITSNVSVRGAGNVWAPATWGNFAPPFGKKFFRILRT
jgi:hypothetical protein